MSGSAHIVDLPAGPDPAARLRGRGAWLRRVLLFGTTLGTAGIAAALMLGILGGDGLGIAEILIIILFTLNFVWIAVSFYTSLIGLVLRALRLDAVTLRRRRPLERRRPLGTRTVVVIPVYNESPARVFAGLRASYESLAETGELAAFDFFILSDTRDPDIWIAEELAWAEACRDLDAQGRIFYRRREHNTERKSGNLKDFCEEWGASYDHMIVFDADSVMSGEAMVQLAYLMEHNPQAGIIQSPPQPVGHETLFARILQFISRVHGPTMATGLAFWQLGAGNYWGHNAILRVSAFMDCCGLPVLSGKPPLGGEILSHDFVEAALMRRAGWEVWLLPHIEGSWEELPPNLIDYAIRDRRWCQGNLQHARLLAAWGFRPLSRLHLFMGVMSFVSSPLWFLLLLVSTFTAFQTAGLQHRFFPEANSLFPMWPVDRSGEMLALLVFTIGMLIVPKLLSILLLFARPDRARAYGGPKLIASGLLEVIYSALQAPIMMLLHTRFVVSILAGRKVGWDAQARGDAGVPFAVALRNQRFPLIAGIAWTALALAVDVAFFWWLAPILAGLLVAPLLVHISARVDLGRAAARAGLFLTPEETTPPAELVALRRRLARHPERPVGDGLLRLIEDPYANALHSALLPERAPDARTASEVSIIYEKLARLGIEALSRDEKVLILSWPVKPLDQVLAGRRHHLRSVEPAAAPGVAE